MYHVSAQGVDERMINVHYYYYLHNMSTEATSYAALSVCHVITVALRT